MPCYYPMQAYQLPAEKTVSKQKSVISFQSQIGSGWQPISLPCGQCVGCRLERSRKWAMRCLFENQMHDSSCFITLTYAPEHLPPNGSLVVKDYQLFMRRLRKSFKGKKIRFFQCGEYGEVCKLCGLSQSFCKCIHYVPSLGRPHYHACLFGIDFTDSNLFIKNSKNDVQIVKVVNGIKLYSSSLLAEIWPYGHSSVGAVTFESAAYVARYIMKKINGDKAQEHYQKLDKDTGEVIDRKPEYTTMSRRPGIGSEWFDLYSSDVYPKDFVTIRNRGRMRPPRYFDNKLKEVSPDLFQEIKLRREEATKDNWEDNTPQRLKVREYCQQRKLNLLKRELE